MHNMSSSKLFNSLSKLLFLSISLILLFFFRISVIGEYINVYAVKHNPSNVKRNGIMSLALTIKELFVNANITLWIYVKFLDTKACNFHADIFSIS